MAMPAIRTEYKGISFRSRLEAKWARMFDFIGWRWEYEPMDLAGWIPDFLLVGTSGNSLLVEVKPILSMSEIEDPLRWKWEKALAESERESDVLVLGVLGPGESDQMGGYSMGWLGELQPGCELWFADAMISRDENGWDLYHPFGWFRHRLSGTHDGDHHLHPPGPLAEEQFDKWWNEATNASQWMRA